jgi:septum formation protein
MKLTNTEKIILASGSPRRKELLLQIGIDIEIRPSSLNEETALPKKPEDYLPSDFVKQLSFLKADDIADLYPESWVLGADTVVVVKGRILGKPASKKDAQEMLKSLSNCEHSVFTGFCILNKKLETKVIDSVETKVTFKQLTKEEMVWYTETKEPFDKAGGYAIQGMGAFFVRSISGSYSNVVGLPVCEVVETLKSLNIIKFQE